MAGRNCCKCVTVSLVPTASLILVILFVCGIILLPILYVELARDYKYGIIIDAGSSHTTLYGYRWRVPTKNNSTGVIEVKETFQCIKKRSLNSFASKPNDSYRAIQHCLTESQNYRNLQIEEKQHQYVPIFLGATAGMRVLEMTNSTASNDILAVICNALKDSGYSFDSTCKDARIISGVEEAVGGWTTTNYLDKNLNPPKESTVGSLDLGGASTQIAFQVFDQPPGYRPSEKLFSQQYNLFARSYLCYGVNEARGRFLAHLINATGKNTSVPDPCLATGTNVTYHRNDIYTGCVIGLAAIEAFGFSIAPPTSLVADGDVNFIGKWNTTECQKSIADVFYFNQCRPESNCPDGNNKFTLPPVNGSFTAFSAFYYTADYFASSNTTVKRENGWEGIRTAVNNNCSKNRKNSTDDCIVNGTVKRFCYQHCFNGLFMVYLLESGYGFNKTTPNNWSVDFQEKLGDVSVGWALGYMLNQTNHIPQDHFVDYRPYSAVDLVVGILILTILCAVFVIFFLLTFYACRKALRPRNGFQPL